MPETFETNVWIKAAETRCAKRIIRDPDKTSDAYAQLARDLRGIAGLEKLLAWTEAKGISVGFEHDGNTVLYPDIKYIRMSTRTKPERQLYLLLHECGHFLIGRNRQPGERFGMGYSMMQGASVGFLRSSRHRIDIIDEEMEAWARGRKLAKKLRIAVDINEWDKLRVDCVKSYIKWFCNIDGYNSLRPGD